MKPFFDWSAWPLLRVVIYQESDPDKYMDDVLVQFHVAAKRGPFVSVTDINEGPYLHTEQRKKLFHGLAEVHRSGRWLAEGIVVRNAMVRGVVTAYSWMRQATAPMRAFATPIEAEVWARKFLPKGDF